MVTDGHETICVIASAPKSRLLLDHSYFFIIKKNMQVIGGSEKRDIMAIK